MFDAFGHITYLNTIISIKTTITEVTCFRDAGSPRAFVCELFSITRTDQEFLLAI